MPEADAVLVADHTHPGLLQRLQLLVGWSVPQTDVGVDASIAIALRIRRRLKPYGKWKEFGIGRWPFRPFRVRIAVRASGEARRRQGNNERRGPDALYPRRAIQSATEGLFFMRISFSGCIPMRAFLDRVKMIHGGM